MKGVWDLKWTKIYRFAFLLQQNNTLSAFFLTFLHDNSKNIANFVRRIKGEVEDCCSCGVLKGKNAFRFGCVARVFATFVVAGVFNSENCG